MAGICSRLFQLTFAIVVLATASVVWAQEHLSEKEINAWHHVQDDVIACVAYFNFGKACAPKNAKPDEIKQLDQTIDHMNHLALTIRDRIGEKPGRLSRRDLLSRLDKAMKDQADLTAGSCTNYPLLTTRYTDRCKLLGEHPEAVFSEYMNK